MSDVHNHINMPDRELLERIAKGVERIAVALESGKAATMSDEAFLRRLGELRDRVRKDPPEMPPVFNKPPTQ